MSQICKDNDVFFEFHFSFCLVKSQDTKEILLQGLVGQDGLYQFPTLQSLVPQTPRSVFVNKSASIVPIVNTACNSISFSTWHSRLGHPSMDAMKIVFKICNIPPINKNVSDFCNHCGGCKFHRLPLS